MIKRVLLTGAKGQVGQSLLKRFRTERHYQVFAFDRESLDITDVSKVQSVFRDIKPHIVINAAAYTAVDKAEEESVKAYAINAEAVRYLAQEAKIINALLIHFSTDYVFDGQSVRAYKEADIPNPLNQYGLSKQMGEAAILEENPPYLILRTSWVFSEYGNNFVKTMLGLASKKSAICVVNDQIGAPTYAGDIAEAIVAMIQQWQVEKHKGIYHFSGLPYVSWFEFAQEMFKIAVKEGYLKYAPALKAIATADYPSLAYRPYKACLDLDKIQQTFTIAPSDWRKALSYCLKEIALDENNQYRHC